MIKVIYFLLSLCVLSCTNGVKDSARIHIEEFPKTVNVKFHEINVEPILYFVGDMQIVNNILVTVDMKNDVYFQFFQLPDLNYLGAQVKKGESPDEELIVFPFIYYMGGDTFAYRSLNQVKMCNYNREQKKLHITKAIELPAEYMNILNCFVTVDAIYGYSMMEKSEKEYRKFDFGDKEKKIVDFGPSFPDVDMKVNGDKQNMIFTKVMAAKTKGDRFAALYDKFPLLRIYDKDGKVISETQYENGQIKPLVYNNTEIQPSELEDYKIDYMKIKVTDKYIYGLYSGKTHQELNTKENKSGDYCSEIHIWSWDGNAVSRLVLPKEVSAFTIAPDDSYILLSSFAHDNVLYKIDMATNF